MPLFSSSSDVQRDAMGIHGHQHFFHLAESANCETGPYKDVMQGLPTPVFRNMRYFISRIAPYIDNPGVAKKVPLNSHNFRPDLDHE